MGMITWVKKGVCGWGSLVCVGGCDCVVVCG